MATASAMCKTSDNSVCDQSIRDCRRLGKYNSEGSRPRPLLVTMNRWIDAVHVLRAKSDSLPDGVSLKPDRSPQERKREAVLMKERWRLIQSGIERNCIKIRQSKLFVNQKLHGQVIDTKFIAQGDSEALPITEALPTANVSTNESLPSPPNHVTTPAATD